MSHLSQEQQDLKASITKSAAIWGVIIGLITAGLVYWIMGSQTTMIRLGAAALGGVVVVFSMYRKSFASGSKSAQCGKCNTAFSISRTDRVETVTSTTDKEERKAQDDGSTEVKTWVEEGYSVLESFTCSKCSDVTKKEYQSTRRKDEKTELVPAPVSSATKGGKQSKAKRKDK